jgi:hypothetical protein
MAPSTAPGIEPRPPMTTMEKSSRLTSGEKASL